MQQSDTSIRLSATDLANHLSCPHLTTLNRAAAEGRIQPPWSHNPRIEVLQKRGFEHERRFLEHLRGRCKSIHVLSNEGTPEKAFENTCGAMRSGADVIVQAALLNGRWYGRADVLLRVETPSELGAWSYEVIDTKLSRETKGGTILQLCTYSDLVAQIQRRLPEHMHVVVPTSDFRPQSFRTQEFISYYRQIQRRLEEAIDHTEIQDATYPEPVPHCDICRWWPVCDRRRRDDDHLSLVAGISRLQRKELRRHEIRTLEAVAELASPLPWRPSRGSLDGYERIRSQAQIQLNGRRSGRPQHELLAIEAGRGLCRLPAPSAGDIFFDLEGDPFVEPGGIEYLWGWATRDGQQLVYSPAWAFTRAEEKSAYEAFVDMVIERLERYPDLHIYHYAPYEPGALKRLMGRYASREGEIDRMLRAGIFVDLYGVVRQALRASVEKYSIKDLEAFYSYVREIPLRDASAALHAVEFALEMEALDSIEDQQKENVRVYNADDCYSAARLQGWLEQLRAGLIEQGVAIDRPPKVPGDPPESVDMWTNKIRPVQGRLLDGISVDPKLRANDEQARWLLAHLLEWHRREDKAPWWEYFRLIELSDEELFEERSALAQLQFVANVGGTDRKPIHRYAFPVQETGIRDDDELEAPGGIKIGKVENIDLQERRIDIKKRAAAADIHPSAVFSHTVIGGTEMAEALFRIARWVLANSMDRAGPYRAARDLLLRRPPRLAGGGSLGSIESDVVSAARRLALHLDHTVLAIQGPPGAGKTYTAARMAVDLIRAGKTVGVTAISHKVIRNLLDAIVAAGAAQGEEIRGIHKVTDLSGTDGDSIQETRSNSAALSALQAREVQLLGGTSWLWAREQFAEAVDVLFIDEAGQLSLANAVAASQGAKSLVLVGDPQQLEQPQQGSHPEGTGVSALEHALAGEKTISPDFGLFLGETWRLHPAICRFTSEQAYENRLRPRPGMERQRIEDHPVIDCGLWLAPTVHEGNRNSSPEEVARIVRIVDSLQSGGVSWRDSAGESHPLGLEDILIVTPYNAQAADLMQALPGARIGTVDKFQGQEAPIVIYSLATSSADEAPRGMDFLYSLNRLNVATSRSRCACILVANPRLFEPECRTPAQMRLANAFSRYLELARSL